MPKRISFLRFLSTLHSLASQLNITATPEGSVTHFHPCFTVTISLWKLPQPNFFRFISVFKLYEIRLRRSWSRVPQILPLQIYYLGSTTPRFYKAVTLSAYRYSIKKGASKTVYNLIAPVLSFIILYDPVTEKRAKVKITQYLSSLKIYRKRNNLESLF